MAGIKIRLVLNSGRNGAPLRRLGGVSTQTERFLRALAVDSGIDGEQAEWVATGLGGPPLRLDVECRGAVDPGAARRFLDSFEAVASIDPDEGWSNRSVRRETVNEYARIGKAIGRDEVVEVAVVPPAGGPLRWHRITLPDSRELASRITRPIPAVCSVQGTIHSWSRGADPPRLRIRELSTNDLVTVEHDDRHHGSIAKAMQGKDTVVIVSGAGFYDALTRRVGRIRLDDIRQPEPLSEEGFNGLFGSVPDLEIDDSWDDDDT